MVGEEKYSLAKYSRPPTPSNKPTAIFRRWLSQYFLPASLKISVIGLIVRQLLALRSFADGSIFGDVKGDDPWVLALHGWARTKNDFDKLFSIGKDGQNELSGIALDLPGFGVSPPFSDAAGSLRYAESVSEIINGLDGKIVVVGHSFGGRVALHLPLLLPEKVAGLILTGVPLVNLARKRPKLTYRLIKSMHNRHLLGAKSMEKARQKFGSSDYANASSEMRQVLVSVLKEDYKPVMRQIKCPVELVWGTEDKVVPPDVAQAALSVFPHANLTLKEGISHLLPLEDPEVIYNLCLQMRSK